MQTVKSVAKSQKTKQSVLLAFVYMKPKSQF